MARAAIFFFMVMGIALAACNRDKVIEGRRLISQDALKAIAVLQAAAREKSPCFDCQIYIGMAYEETGDLTAASAAYEAALAMPEAASRPEPVAARLLDVYEKRFAQAADKVLKVPVAEKAAAIEVALKVANPWANPYLFEVRYAEFKAAAQAGNTEAALAVVKLIMSLYLPPSKKSQVSIETTDMLKNAFEAKATEVFTSKLASRFEEDGRYDAETKEIVISNRFRIPSPDDDEKFDPKKDGFKLALRKAACEPLRKTMGEVVMECSSAIGARKPAEADLDRLFVKLFQYSKAGYAIWGAEKKDKPAGLPYICEIRLPLGEFLGELFRFSSQ